MLGAIKEIMGAGVSAEAPLTSAGLDSLGAVELRKELAGLTGLELPSTLVFDYPSAQAISELIAGQLTPASLLVLPSASMRLEALLLCVMHHSWRNAMLAAFSEDTSSQV